MSFLNPLFLFGLLAAGVPILIHLFTRKRPRDIPFPSIEFLSEVNRSEIRRLKLKQWILLLLRTLAVAALALAMSRPAVRTLTPTRSGAATTVVALVDQSGSMGAAAPEGTIGLLARRVADLDRGGRPAALAEAQRPSADVPRLRAAIHLIEPGARATDHARALGFAARVLAESHALNRELFWISDFQAAGFARTLTRFPGPWEHARVYLVPVAPARRSNVALSEASLAPSEDGAALAVTAQGFSAHAGDLAVEVRGAGSDQVLGRGFLAMPEQGEVSTLVPLKQLPEQGGVVTIGDDALALDNRRWFAAGRAGMLHVLLREDGPPSALRLALEAGTPVSGLAVETVAASDLPSRIAETDVLVLNDLERLGPVELQAALDFYRGGGALLIALSRRADPAFWNTSLLREIGAGELGPLAVAPANAAWRMRRAVAGHPALAGFPARPGEPLSTAQFRAIRPLSPGSRSRVLLEFDRAHAALVEVPHGLVLAAPLDPESSDFAVSGAFLPLLHQAVKVLGRGTAAASLIPGQRYTAPASTGPWRIEDATGRDVPSELVASEGATRLVSAPLERPGLYRVLQAGAVRASFAVNPDPRESDLATAPTDAVLRAFPPGRALVLASGRDLARRVREARYGRELWAWFAALALASLVAETIVARSGMPGRATAP